LKMIAGSAAVEQRFLSGLDDYISDFQRTQALSVIIGSPVTDGATVTGDLQGGTYGTTWVIDPTQTPVMNRAFRDWNTDFFALLKANSLSVVCSFSQELVNPPDNRRRPCGCSGFPTAPPSRPRRDSAR
jgi:hypothetical protein